MGLENINEIRKYRGLTLEQLSEISGVPLSTVKKINAGITANPSLDTVSALAKALNCTLDDLESPVWAKEKPATNEGDGLNDLQREVLNAMLELDPDDMEIVKNLAISLVEKHNKE